MMLVLGKKILLLFFILLQAQVFGQDSFIRKKKLPNGLTHSNPILLQSNSSNIASQLNHQKFLLPGNEIFETPKASVFCHIENIVRNKTNVWLLLRLDNYDYKIQKKSFEY